MKKHLLSKSTFIRGNQCLKSLYLNKKRPFLRDRMPKERLIVFQRGHKVGEYAQQLFPGGINMSPGHPAAYRKALVNTKEKIREGYPVIYEAAFQYDQVLIFLDILVHTATGWHAYEVKSSGGISDTYLLDAALQYHVIRGTGIELAGISLVHIDKDYVLEETLDPHGLFNIVDVTDEALSRQEYVAEQIIREKEALELSHSPKIDVGPHCREPYDCDFLGHCWKNVPGEPEMAIKDQIDRQQLTKAEGKVAFIKYLSMRPAIPKYQGTHPYQEIMYAYSIMDMDKNLSETKISAYENNPEIQLLPALAADMANIDTLICFGQGWLLRTLFNETLTIIDLKEMILDNSSFFTDLKDKSELERLGIIFNLNTDTQLPEDLSDAVAEHNYLKDDVPAELEGYMYMWVSSLHQLYCKLSSKS
jgi:hypothetical protein